VAVDGAPRQAFNGGQLPPATDQIGLSMPASAMPFAEAQQPLFAFLAEHAPEPFKSEWSGGKGRNIHHKFVVTDFNLPTAKVFTGSSNFSPSGEAGNGDQLIMIDDAKIATAYAIEAVRVFDHLQFRDRMRGAFGAQRQRLAKATAPKRITLRKPTAISGADEAWFDRFYKPDTQAFRDRVVFST
jgi:phosphatidylserine/phosphatidylglycerophosphate/cardiolipin synthase-like enzyme